MVEENPSREDDSAERGGLYLAAFAAFSLPALIVLAAYLPSSPVSLASSGDGDRVLDALEIDASSLPTSSPSSSILKLDAVVPPAVSPSASDKADDQEKGASPDDVAKDAFSDQTATGNRTETKIEGDASSTSAPSASDASPVTIAVIPVLVGTTPTTSGPRVPATPITPISSVAPASPGPTVLPTTVTVTPTTTLVPNTPSSTNAVAAPNSIATPEPPITPTPVTPPVTITKPTITKPTIATPTTATPPTRPTITTPQFARSVEIGSIDTHVVRLRFASDQATSYRVTASNSGTVAATVNGQAQTGQTESVTLSGLQGGTAYKITVVLDDQTSSGAVAVRTPGGQVALASDQVKILGLGTTSTGRTWVQLNYQSNVCANGSFVIRDLAGNRVGSNAGQADGCTTQHLAVPGKWTAALTPGTSYDISITVEANGAGQGGGNAQTSTMRIRTND